LLSVLQKIIDHGGQVKTRVTKEVTHFIAKSEEYDSTAKVQSHSQSTTLVNYFYRCSYHLCDWFFCGVNFFFNCKNYYFRGKFKRLKSTTFRLFRQSSLRKSLKQECSRIRNWSVWIRFDERDSNLKRIHYFIFIFFVFYFFTCQILLISSSGRRATCQANG
jgi:hypothetical protein